MNDQRHPYADYEREAVWKVLDRSLRALAKNGDVEEKTAHAHVVGYLAKALTEAGFKQVSELRTGQRTMRVIEVREQSNGSVRKRAGAA